MSSKLAKIISIDIKHCLVDFGCPYCKEKSYMDVYDDYSEPITISCEYCEKEFRIKVKFTFKPK